MKIDGRGFAADLDSDTEYFLFPRILQLGDREPSGYYAVAVVVQYSISIRSRCGHSSFRL